jgi:hypothetical protein
VTLLTNFSANEDFFAVFWTRLTKVLVGVCANIKQQTWTVGHYRSLPFPSVCAWQRMSWPHQIGETHQPDWVVYIRDRNLWKITFRLTNVILERIIFVSRSITVPASFFFFMNHFLFLYIYREICMKLNRGIQISF